MRKDPGKLPVSVNKAKLAATCDVTGAVQKQRMTFLPKTATGVSKVLLSIIQSADFINADLSIH